MEGNKTPEQQYSILKNFFIFEHRFNVAFDVLEAVALAICGALIGRFNDKTSGMEVGLLVTTGLIFLLLFIRRTARGSFFPLSALGELYATTVVKEAESSLQRKRSIDRYIDKAVQALNSNTCNYTGISVENFLCDSSLEEGFKSVYEPFFVNPQYLVNEPLSKFTIGATLSDVTRLPAGFIMNGGRFAQQRGSISMVPRDDFNFSQDIPDDILWVYAEGRSYHLQHQLGDTFRHGKFIVKNFMDDQKEYTFITAPIPQVCENAGSRGVFFMICEAIVPSIDLEDVTIIFSRLFANWLSKYEDCVTGRIEKSNQTYAERQQRVEAQPPPEVVELERRLREEQGNNELTPGNSN